MNLDSFFGILGRTVKLPYSHLKKYPYILKFKNIELLCFLIEVRLLSVINTKTKQVDQNLGIKVKTQNYQRKVTIFYCS